MDIKQQENSSQSKSSSRSDLSTSVVNIRCPSCFKLYTVKTVEIHDHKPKFKCSSCEQVFWINYPECLGPEEVLGYPEVVPETQSVDFKLKDADFVEESYRDCPKCDSKNPNASKECGSCGIVFAKYEEQKKQAVDIPAPANLKAHWDSVIENYEDEAFHQDFIDRCTSEKNLDYAAQKYAKILKGYAGDATARQMTDRIESIAMARFGEPLLSKKPKSEKRFRWTFLLMSLGLSMALIGYFIPQLRNMVGVGVSLMFLTAAVRFYFR